MPPAEGVGPRAPFLPPPAVRDRMVPSQSTIPKAVLFHAEVAAWLLALVLLIVWRPWGAAGAAAAGLLAHEVGRQWSRRSPVPMPWFMRWVLLLPRGPHSPARLAQVLRPRSGERVLEIGPGVGVHALPVAAALRPDGRLDVLDVQQEMLDDLGRRAQRAGIANLVACRGDARALPYADATFDAGYLVSVLGEIPDPAQALRELRRVLKPAARLVVAEVFVDPDFVALQELQQMAREAGFAFELRRGPRCAYVAGFRRGGGSGAAAPPS